MFNNFCCRFCILLGAICRYNPQYNPQNKCSKTRGGGGKDCLNNVKKQQTEGVPKERQPNFFFLKDSFSPPDRIFCRESLTMVNVPKLRKTYCPHPACRSHKPFKVTQYKKSAESKQAQGRRRWDRIQESVNELQLEARSGALHITLCNFLAVPIPTFTFYSYFCTSQTWLKAFPLTHTINWVPPPKQHFLVYFTV